MLRIFLSSLILILAVSCTVPSSNIIIHQDNTPKELNSSTIYKITIPVREHGYSNFETQVYTSEKELNSFISQIKKQKNWNKKENFIKSLTAATINFKLYNLLIYRTEESSGSTVLAVNAPKGTNKHVLIKIGRDRPGKGQYGTADMAYYALAYKVAKTVQDISFDNGLKKESISNEQIQQVSKDKIPKGCVAWFDGCNNCARHSENGEVMCTERYCYQKGEFKCTKWK